MDQTITLALWRLPGAKYKIECYFWCTLDGAVPGAPQDRFRQDDIAKLMNLTTGLTPIMVNSEDDQKKQYASPVTIYQLVNHVSCPPIAPSFLHKCHGSLQDLNQGDLQPCTRQNSTSPPCAATSDHYVWSPRYAEVHCFSNNLD